MGARLGQHFLSDPSILRRIAAAAVADPGEDVLEIGPGKGSLTRELAARARRVVAIEADRALAAALADACAGSNVTVVAGDALKVPWPEAAVVCGNIPYQITSPLVDRALRPPRPARIVFLVQDEVARRLAAAPGAEGYGALTAGVRLVATVERLFGVPAGAFRPRPRVDSAVVRLVPRADPLVASEAEERRARTVVQALFQRRRQQLGRSVREAFGVGREEAAPLLAAAGIAPAARPEVLAPERFVALARALGPRLAS
ncbi:MAG TPA: 16S rRNA (adenine(1518)-N(6)/adenine(1519)-N(6))-dimethyltransferase RsmA [Gemmatimonadales bacterium]|nr:16S rRNA (adenine(1518)-N(6)/adenine(1519)-N(6))-dimethyltransferase RsmA [Gemmatimonadales bacterium]